MVVAVKSTVFWVEAPCISKRARRFGGTFICTVYKHISVVCVRHLMVDYGRNMLCAINKK
jgi:hypothetical protein